MGYLSDVSARLRPADCGREVLGSRRGALQGVSNRTHMACYLCNCCWRCRCDSELASRSAYWRPANVRSFHAYSLCPNPARGPRRECAGSPPQHPNGTDGTSQLLPLLEHELPPRTSHVPDGALPQACRLARGD